MSLFKGIVKLTEEQYLTLKNGGTITNDLGTFTFDENVLYVTDTDFSQMKTKIVESLPEVGEINTIYMVLKEGSSTDYNRYMYINDRYTIIGETTINLAGYAKLDDIPTSLPASDVYSWAKQPTKPSYSVSELPNELLTTSKAEIGGNSVTSKQSFSVVRNTSNEVHQGLLSINDNGSVRLSHRNKSVNSNVDDSYIDLDANGMVVNGNEVAIKDEVYEFGKGVYEESSNLFNFPNIVIEKNGITYTVQDGIIHYKGTTSATQDSIVSVEFDTPIVLENDTVTVSLFNDLMSATNISIAGLFDIGLGWDANLVRTYENQTMTITKIHFYVSTNKTVDGYIRPVMVKGKKAASKFIPYNPNRHITNGQADLLKEHYTLCVNELNLNDTNKNLVNVDIIIKDEILNINGEKTEEAISYYFWDNNNSIVGKRKVKLFHFGGTTTATLQIIINRNNSNVQQFMFNGSKFSTENEAEVEFDGNERMFLYFGTGIRTATNLQIGITFSQYDIETFHSYKSGKIIHEKDITPVLLWENAVSSSSFSEQQIELISDDYEELEIEYLDYNLNYIEKRVFRADKSIILNGSLGWYVADNNLTLNFYSRYLTRLDSTHYNVNECVEILYKSTTDSPTIKVNNERLIPNRIWGRKMKL